MSATWPSAVSTAANLFTTVNLLQTTLSGTINSAVTTIALTSTTGFPTAGAVTIDNEVIFYTNISGGNLTGCVRGSDGTTAASHNSGVPVGATVVAYHVNALNAEVIAIETDLHTRFGFPGSNNQALLVDGAVANPAMSFASDTNTGFYRDSSHSVSLAINGVRAWTIDSSSNLVSYNGGQVLGADGSAGSPSFAFKNSTSAGLYKIGTNDIGFSTASTLAWEVNATQQFILPKVSNQMIFGTTNTTTFSVTAPSTSRVYTFPDVAADASVLLNKGNYTLTGTWTNATLVTPALGTPSAGVLTSCTGLPIDGGTINTLPVNRGGTGVTTSTGTGNVVLSASPTLSGTPVLSGDAIRGSDAGVTFRTKYHSSIVDSGTAVLTNSNQPDCFAIVITDQGYSAGFLIRGGFNAAVIAFDPSSQFSIASGTGSRTNVYYSSGNGRYEIENKTGGTRTYSVFYFSQG